MISIQNISKRFRRLKALDGINADFSSGQVVSLIGPNGSGKSTLIKCILGMVRADQGEIFVDGKKISNDPSYRNRIGYMPQIGRYPDNMRVGQLFRMLKNIRNIPENIQDSELIDRFNLGKIENQFMRTLSGGTRQKVSSAVAFMFNPSILILDEPSAGLDPLSSEILKEKIMKEKRKGKLILITSHILSDLDELTSHVMYLQEGKLQFLSDIETLRRDTGELKLGKVIAGIMRKERTATIGSEELSPLSDSKLKHHV